MLDMIFLVTIASPMNMEIMISFPYHNSSSCADVKQIQGQHRENMKTAMFWQTLNLLLFCRVKLKDEQQYTEHSAL